MPIEHHLPRTNTHSCDHTGADKAGHAKTGPMAQELIWVFRATIWMGKLCQDRVSSLRHVSGPKRSADDVCGSTLGPGEQVQSITKLEFRRHDGRVEIWTGFPTGRAQTGFPTGRARVREARGRETYLSALTGRTLAAGHGGPTLAAGYDGPTLATGHDGPSLAAGHDGPSLAAGSQIQS
ncbi:hypothetical protein CROQUDRAFT_109243 [Cronartium quercuum f. sp. fusiforme G11]|uniref:Uncharacterized protein n=1 Tax=Cronartium quercuum f. sp. fusiforme G11 TaxID=708437 RepID=A0A9P6NB52_9BASI|nr:hypothetical protein CROQUDRAFT_109243 [Cronartium quercuum f. sp. fusiforme G11]